MVSENTYHSGGLQQDGLQLITSQHGGCTTTPIRMFVHSFTYHGRHLIAYLHAA